MITSFKTNQKAINNVKDAPSGKETHAPYLSVT